MEDALESSNHGSKARNVENINNNNNSNSNNNNSSSSNINDNYSSNYSPSNHGDCDNNSSRKTSDSNNMMDDGCCSSEIQTPSVDGYDGSVYSSSLGDGLEDMLIANVGDRATTKTSNSGNDENADQKKQKNSSSSRKGIHHHHKAKPLDDVWDVFGFVKSTTRLCISTKEMVDPQQQQNTECPETKKWRSDWSQYVTTLQLNGDEVNVQKTRALKLLVRKGIPNEYRGEFWKCFGGVNRVRQKYTPEYYKEMASSPEAKEETQAVKEIDRDVFRTFPGHRVYATAQGRNALRRVLVTYSVHNKEVGYCQSLNYLVAMLLLFMNEEDAFWAVETIVKYVMPRSYYSTSMKAAMADANALEEIVRHSIPTLSAKLHELQVELQLITVEWFLCLFVNCSSLEFMLRVWDIFFFEGAVTLFRVSVGLLKAHEAALLKETSYHELFAAVRNVAVHADASEVFKYAFAWPHRIPRKDIEKIRKQQGVADPSSTIQTIQKFSLLNSGRRFFRKSHEDASNMIDVAAANNSNVDEEAAILTGLRRGATSSTPQRGFDNDSDDDPSGLFRAPSWFANTSMLLDDGNGAGLAQVVVDDYAPKGTDDGIVYDAAALNNIVEDYFA